MASVRALAVAAAAMAACVAAATPEQIHIALTGDPTEMLVSWVTKGTTAGTASVAFGSTTAVANTAKGTYSKFTAGGTIDSIVLYDTLLTGLTPGVLTFYKVSGDSVVRNFTAAPAVGTGAGRTYALIADFGLTNDVSLDQLKAEAANGVFDALIHAGDLAYNLQDDRGAVGNDFVNALQPVVSRVPWMTTVGNHEADYINNAPTFSVYNARFAGIANTTGKRSGSGSARWYSFDDGLVHFIAIDTELFSYGGTSAQIQAQYEWLAADAKTIDRAKTPWVVAFGHKQRWMDQTIFTTLEELLHAAGVDLYICGHQHNYQRIAPNYKGTVETACVKSVNVYERCSSMATIVVGSPGCDERISTGKAPGDQLVKQFLNYGYGHLHVNATALHVTWEQTGLRDLATGALVPRAGADADDFWILK